MTVFIISIVYILATLIIGMVVGRKNQEGKSFFVAQEKLSLPLCCALLMASSFAGAYTSGSAADSYLGGFAPYIPMAAMGFGYILCIWLIPYYRNLGKAGHLSIPETFEVRFGKKTRVCILFINCFVYAATFAFQPVALATVIAPMLGLNKTVVIWCASAVMVLMALNGLTGVAWMNLVHAIIMVGGMTVISIVAMIKAGGISNIAATVDPQMWSVFDPNVPTSILRLMAQGLSMLPASEAATIAMGAKNKKTAKRALIIIGVLIFIFTFFLMMIGLSARTLEGMDGSFVIGDDNASNTLYVLSSYLGTGFSIIASIAVLAAITSSAPAYLIYTSTNITRQITQHVPEEKSKKLSKIISVVCIVAVAGIGTFLAQKASSILYALFNIYDVMAIVGLVLFIGNFWKKVSERSAFLTITISGVVSIIWIALGNPGGIVTAWISIPLTVVLLVVFTLIEKKPVSDGYARVAEINARFANED